MYKVSNRLFNTQSKKDYDWNSWKVNQNATECKYCSTLCFNKYIHTSCLVTLSHWEGFFHRWGSQVSSGLHLGATWFLPPLPPPEDGGNDFLVGSNQKKGQLGCLYRQHFIYYLNLFLLFSSLYGIMTYFNLLEDLGRPSPIVTDRVFPPGLSWATSPGPFWNTTILVPPPPQPSFFTLNSSLKQEEPALVTPACFSHASKGCVFLYRPVTEGDCQFSFCHFLVAFGKQTEELCLKVGFQQTVILGFVEDEEIILSRTKKEKKIPWTHSCWSLKTERGSSAGNWNTERHSRKR